jgi:hypothetical protein
MHIYQLFELYCPNFFQTMGIVFRCEIEALWSSAGTRDSSHQRGGLRPHIKCSDFGPQIKGVTRPMLPV